MRWESSLLLIESPTDQLTISESQDQEKLRSVVRRILKLQKCERMGREMNNTTL